MEAIKRVIVYCRESRDENGEKIERIETQRDILLAYCKRNNLSNIVDIVMDNNVSGTKFERLEEIAEKIRTNQIDVLVFKDASRLGRNLLESLKFVQLADDYGVEVLFESENYSEELFPLLAWFNEQRAREDSKKIRRVLQHKMETGELLIRPIYGYLKIGRQLVPDPVTAPVVQRIFKLYAEGKGTRQIATILNYEGIPTPSQYNDTPVKSGAWVQQQVYRIINNRAYMGEMVYGKTQKKSFKSKKVTRTRPEQRIVVQNHHEAIIGRELFEQAQLMKAQYAIKSSGELSAFSGLIKCGRCGRSLIKRTRKNGESFYECIKYHQEGVCKPEIRENYGCASHRLYEKELLRLLYDYCRAQLSGDGERMAKSCRDSLGNEANAAYCKYQAEIHKNKKIIERLYDDRLNGVIGAELYQKKYGAYAEKLETLEERLLDAARERDTDERSVRAAVAGICEGDLDNFALKRLLEKMVYYLPGEITIKDKQETGISDACYRELQSGGLLICFR